MKLHDKISPLLPVGKTAQGMLAIIPIIGGSFSGPDIRWTVCHGRADWNTRLDETHSHVFAKYWLKTDGGEYIAIENEGIIDNTQFETSEIGRASCRERV